MGFWKKGFSAVGEDGKVTYCNNGPCYGECGNGERFRTQGVPKKSKELDYVHVMQVSKRPDIFGNTNSFPARLVPEPTTLSTSSETPRTTMLRRSRSTRCWIKSR